MNNPLVTILSPCYNKGDVLHRFMDSVIAQTYRPIELIVVNDGSTDNSEEALLSYQKKMSDANITYKYIWQENGGVSVAINTGLQAVTGVYVTWPDIDDWMEPNCVEEKIKVLEADPQLGVVFSLGRIFDSTDLHNPVGTLGDDSACVNFWDFLSGNGIVCPAAAAARTSALFDSLDGKEIFPSRFGQNLQLIYPLLYHYKSMVLPKMLFNYVIYEDSLSHHAKSFEKKFAEREGRYELKLETIRRIPKMNSEDREKALKILDKMEAKYRLKLAAEFNNSILGAEQKDRLEKMGTFDSEERHLYRCSQSRIYSLLYRKAQSFKETLYKLKRKFY